MMFQMFKIFVVVAALGVAAFYAWFIRPQQPIAVPQATATSAPQAGQAAAQGANGQLPIGGSFQLTSDTGQVVTEKALIGTKYHLLFFGFSNCPDACPGMLQTMAGIMEQLPPATQQKLQMVFISIDPTRDTAAKLHEYVRGFHPSFISWYGTPAQINDMTKKFMAYAAKRPDPSAPDGYTMDHSTMLYVMGPNGGYLTHLSQSDSTTTMRDRLTQLVK